MTHELKTASPADCVPEDVTANTRGALRAFIDMESHGRSPTVQPWTESGTFRLDPVGLRCFLRLGYVPGVRTLFRGVRCVSRPGRFCAAGEDHETGGYVGYAHLGCGQPYRSTPLPQLLKDARHAWLNAVQRCYDAGRRILVPLSAGLDSRAILGGLLECTSASHITTFTRGVPGTADFDWAPRVAKAAGVDHIAIDLREYPLREDPLRETARLVDGNTFLFDAYYHQKLLEDLPGDEYWSGFLGDGSCGIYQPKRPLATRDDFVAQFAREEDIYNPRGLLLDDRPEHEGEDWDDLMFPECLAASDANELTTYEVIALEHRTERLLANIVVSPRIPCKIPFAELEWLRFALSIPKEHRRRRRLFVRCLQQAFPALMAEPTTEFWGLPVGSKLRSAWHNRKRIARHLGRRLGVLGTVCWPVYIDFAERIRARGDLYVLVRQAAADWDRRGLLARRGAAQALLKEHMAGEADHAMLLCLLTSLEMILDTWNVRW